MDEEESKIIKSMLADMNKCLQVDVSQAAAGHVPFRLPKFPINSVLTLIFHVKKIFEREQTVISMRSPVNVVGDIHGHFLDLIRILQTFGLPFTKQFLFLGDFVDRGEFMIETVIYVYLLKANFPEKVQIIRGNHEFESLCSTSGFLSEVMSFYNDRQLFYAFMESFSVMPLAAIIDDSILAVHGGIGPELTDVNQIKRMVRPIEDFGNEELDSLLWSDPLNEIEGFEVSKRGSGYYFGGTVLKKFLQMNNLSKLIRGHECVNDGVCEMFNGQCVTVFSASNYCGTVGNKSAVLTVQDRKTFNIKRYPPLPYFLRRNALYPGMVSPFDENDKDSARLNKLRPPPLESITKFGSLSSMATLSPMVSGTVANHQKLGQPAHAHPIHSNKASKVPPQQKTPQPLKPMKQLPFSKGNRNADSAASALKARHPKLDGPALQRRSPLSSAKFIQQRPQKMRVMTPVRKI